MNNKERLDIVDLYNGTDDHAETTSSSIGLDPLDAKSHGNHYTHVKHSYTTKSCTPETARRFRSDQTAYSPRASSK